MMVTMTTFTIRSYSQTPASQNSTMKYIVDTTYVTGKSMTNPIYHTAEDATIKALCDYVLFIHQYDSVNLGLGISGNQNAVAFFTGSKTAGSSNITDSVSLHKVTISDTLYLPAVANAVNADSPLVVGINKKTVRKVSPPSATAPLSVTWPGNIYSLGTVGVANGGTGITTYTVGDLPYASGTTAMSRLPAGSTGQVLEIQGGAPSWQTIISGTSSVSNADGSLTVSPTSGAVICGLNPAHANTWTGTQTFSMAPVFSTANTNGGILYGNSTGVLQQSSAGTATTVLHGGTTPSYSAVSLTTDAGGTLQAAQFPALTGDITTSAGGLAATLKNTGTPGTYGSATVVPVFTTDAQGRVTGVSNTNITYPLSTLGAIPYAVLKVIVATVADADGVAPVVMLM